MTTAVIKNVVDTDMKTIRTYRKVHETSEYNAFLEECEKQAELRESGGRQSDVKMENERTTNRKIQKRRDDQVEREREVRKAFEELQTKLLSTPTPPPKCYDEPEEEVVNIQREEEETPPFDPEAWKKMVIEDIDESFKIFDINGDGKISLHEVMSIMQSVGKDITIEDAQDIVEYIDRDGDGSINYEEFKDLMFEKMSEKTVDEDLEDCFNIFDTDGDGFISPLEMQQTFKKLGQLISVDDAVEIMEDCDLNKDGLIDFEEFKAFHEKIVLEHLQELSGIPVVRDKDKKKAEEEEAAKEKEEEETNEENPDRDLESPQAYQTLR